VKVVIVEVEWLAFYKLLTKVPKAFVRILLVHLVLTKEELMETRFKYSNPKSFING
jgi:hypothetical protein